MVTTHVAYIAAGYQLQPALAAAAATLLASQEAGTCMEEDEDVFVISCSQGVANVLAMR